MTVSHLFTFFVLLPLMVIGAAVVHYWPAMLLHWATSKEEVDPEALRQEELLARKIQIFEQAQAARARGEAFVPPKDWNAW